MVEGVDLGGVAYSAYRVMAEGRSLVSGEVLPPWEGVSPVVAGAWRAAAGAVAAVVRGEVGRGLGGCG